MNKVNLLILGEQKCGTTTLKNVLNNHSDINFILREMHVFDFDLDPYEKYGPLIKDVKYNGECTPLYLYNKQSITNILKYNPDTKFLIILRNPILRAKSAHSMLFRHKREYRTFNEAIEQQITLLNVEEETAFVRARKHYLKRGFYVDSIKRLFEYVDKKNVHIIISENIWTNPEEELNKIFDFLEIPKLTIDFQHKNKGHYDNTIDPEIYKKLDDLYKPKTKELEELLGISIPW